MPLPTPEQISSKLGPAAALAERGFLAAGQSLEGAREILDRLITRFAAYTDELMGGALEQTSEGLSTASAQIAALADTNHSDVAALEPPGLVVGEISRRVAALEPVTREVQTLSLNARVVAGGMGEAGADFLAFSESIRGAAGRARSSLDAVREGLALVELDLGAARADAITFAARHGETLRSIPARLATNLRGLTAQRRMAGDAAETVRRRSEDIRHQIASQIVALQLGDATRQRVEHATEAARLVTGAGSPRRAVGGLLAAQLRDTADALAQEGERIETRLKQLEGAARAIGDLGSALRGETNGRDGGFVADLEADIRRTLSPLAELRTADAATEQRMAAVLSAAETLALRFAILRDVEEDIRIMGLNATLKCGRLGPAGRPLAIVAQELRACGARFAGDAAAALGDLDRLRATAAGLRDPMREARHAALAEAMDGMLAALRRLGELETRMVSTLTQLQVDADAVGRLVQTALSQFAVRHALAETLRQGADAFASWVQSDEAEAGGGRDVLDRIATGYTMAREREVHARVSPLPASLAAAAAAAAVSNDLADVLF